MGKKTSLYHKTQLEKFAEYLNKDGLVSCLTLYRDTAREWPNTCGIMTVHYVIWCVCVCVCVCVLIREAQGGG